MIRRVNLTVVVLLAGLLFQGFSKKLKPDTHFVIGQPIDSLHSVKVYYNGPMDNVGELNITPDNYNIGIRYQCVEFAKRYYYQHYHHKMPEIYGNAKDFFDKALSDGTRNTKRDLIQYTNPSLQKPAVSDLLIYDATRDNPYGHVAIISKVGRNGIEIIQQNPGPDRSTRERYDLSHDEGKWKIEDPRILGWLRKE